MLAPKNMLINSCVHLELLLGWERAYVCRNLRTETEGISGKQSEYKSGMWHKSLVCSLLVLYSNYLLQMPCFSVLRLWHTYVDSNPNRGSKSSHQRLKKCSKFAEKCTFEPYFPTFKLYANCSFHIFAFQRKFLLFEFLSRGMRLHIPILTGVQIGRIRK